MPAVFLHRVDLAALQLALFHVFVPTEGVDILALPRRDRGEEALLLEHGTLVDDVPIDVLEAIVAHPSKQEPSPNVFILSLSDYICCSECSSIEIDKSKMARELSLEF